MDFAATLEGGAQGALEAILEVKVAPPIDDVGEEIAIQRGVVGQQRLEVKGCFGGDQLIEPDLPRFDHRPVLQAQTMRRVRPRLPNLLENHEISLVDWLGLGGLGRVFGSGTREAVRFWYEGGLFASVRGVCLLRYEGGYSLPVLVYVVVSPSKERLRRP